MTADEQALARVEADLKRLPCSMSAVVPKADLRLLLSLARQAGEMREALESSLACLRHTHDRLVFDDQFDTLRLTLNAECRRLTSILAALPAVGGGNE